MQHAALRHGTNLAHLALVFVHFWRFQTAPQCLFAIMHVTSACNQLFETVELIDLILQYVPLDDLLRCRQVSKTWRDLVERSKILQRIQQNPYVGVLARTPRECSLLEGENPTLEADFVLWHDKSVTILRSPSCLNYPGQIFFKVEEGATPPETLPPFTWGGCFRTRAFRLNREKADQWVTLYPGRPVSLSWQFRPGQSSAHFGSGCATSGNLADAEVGKRYILRLRSGMRLSAYVGVKEQLLTELEEGDKKAKSLKRFKMSDGLRLVSEDEAHFTVVP